MDPDVVMFFSNRATTLFLNLALVFLFLYLRTKGEKEPLTLSQRWGLSILVWLFLLNSLTLMIEAIMRYLVITGDTTTEFLFSRLNQDVDILIGSMLLAFGLVYPRPYAKWSRLRFILFGILGFAATMLLIQLVGHRSVDLESYMAMNTSSWAYIFGWYVPVIIWLNHYQNETSSDSRIVLSLFIWAFIGSSVANQISTLYASFFVTKVISAFSIISIVFFVYVLARIIHIVIKGRASWGLAEKIHVMFLGFYILGGLIKVTLVGTVLSDLLLFLTGNASWTIIRPALFAYAILRYQIFGPQLKIARPLSYIIGITASFFTVIFAQFIPFPIAVEMKVGIGIGLAFLMFIPYQRMARRIVRRHLPMTAKGEVATMREKRTRYLISLQTAIVKGSIDDPDDRASLSEQRKLLGISDREHELLMDSFMAREERGKMKVIVDELFLVNIDGRLLVHVGRKVKGKVKGRDKDVVAGMLVAIRDYVQEGLRTGRGRSLDSIRYGDYSLMIETEGRLVLAAVLRGPDSPDLRQYLRDQLTLIKRRHGATLEKWDGDRSNTDGARHILEGFMEELDLL